MKGVYIFGIAYYSDGTSKRSRWYRNPEAFSRWANAQWYKDNDVTIEEYKFDMRETFPKHTCTWHQ